MAEEEARFDGHRGIVMIDETTSTGEDRLKPGEHPNIPRPRQMPFAEWFRRFDRIPEEGTEGIWWWHEQGGKYRDDIR